MYPLNGTCNFKVTILTVQRLPSTLGMKFKVLIMNCSVLQDAAPASTSSPQDSFWNPEGPEPLLVISTHAGPAALVPLLCVPEACCFGLHTSACRDADADPHRRLPRDVL